MEWGGSSTCSPRAGCPIRSAGDSSAERQGVDGFSLTASGDFVGRGVWTFRQEGDFVEATYDWRIRAEKPLLRRLTWLLRPIFAANHPLGDGTWPESLILELARRRVQDPVIGAAIPPPTFARRRARQVSSEPSGHKPPRGVEPPAER